MMTMAPGLHDGWRPLAAACSVAAAALLLLGILWRRPRQRRRLRESVQRLRAQCAAARLVGDTRMVELTSLSRATGCRILAKVEWENPGGSVKDRVALYIIADALESGRLRPGGTIYEGTAGSTGISLAMLARALGLRAHICVPSDQAIEKTQLLERLGATVERITPVSFSNPEHFCNVAQRHARADPNGYFADQFDNASNYAAHYEGTGQEIWTQTAGRVDAVVLAAGTGGSIAGITQALREHDPRIRTFLVDPQGSALFARVKYGVLYSTTDAEGKRKRHQVDSITEGVGINRLTANFKRAALDDAVRASDREAVEMSRFLLREEALFVGSSSAVNVVGAVKVARMLGPGHTIVTLLCDSGQRHLSKFWNPAFLETAGLTPTATGLEFLDST